VSSFLTVYTAVRIIEEFLCAVKILTLLSCTQGSAFAGNLSIFVVSGPIGGKKGRFRSKEGHASAGPA
jgi:hypothetical protein